jgi:predicted 2-oxoglutarate/Fe(II)-dependent dioxygenase YbiX
MLLKDYILVKQTYSKDFCTALINHSEKNTWQKHRWTTRENDSHLKESIVYDHKELEVQDLEDPFKKDFFNQSVKTLQYYIDNIVPNKNNIIYKLSKPRVNKYKTGSFMREHIDHISYIFNGTERGIPAVSLIALLNNDFEGGDVFINNFKYTLNMGDLLIFPSNFLYPHTVSEITKGTRYSVVSWGY